MAMHQGMTITGVAQEIGRRIMHAGVANSLHFDRTGRGLCVCCKLEGLADYRRRRELRLDGKIYLLVCDKAYTRTNSLTGGYGFENDVFSAEVLKTAQIFEIDIIQLRYARCDPEIGQRRLEGKEHEGVIQKIMGNQGELFTLTKIEGETHAPGFYLHDEARPQGPGILASVVV